MSVPHHNINVAVAHKDYDVAGGGEVVAEELARTFNAPLFVGRLDESKASDDIDVREIPLTSWQRRAIDHGGAARSLAYMAAWQRVEPLRQFDVIVTSGNEPLWYVPEDDQTLVAYTHSPPRWQFDLFQRETHSLLGLAYHSAARTLLKSHAEPDHWIANSDRVARRIRLYLDADDEDLTTIYPPVSVSDHHPSDAPTSEFYLYLGRICGHKRVGEVVDAFRQSDEELVVAGTGPERERLEADAPSNVVFRGYVDEHEKRQLLAGAQALVYPPANEDFGMVAIESMAAGTPVIGVNEGFTTHQILDGQNGLLWDRGELASALTRFAREGVAWSGAEIAAFAREHFGEEKFRRGVKDVVRRVHARERVRAPWEDQTDATPTAASEPAMPDGGQS